MPSTCSSCGARIFWAKTASGRSMPVDQEPDRAGNLIIEDGVIQVVGPEDLEFLDPPRRGQIHTSHFATCPNAAAHRRSLK